MATGTDGSEDALHPAGPPPNREGKREPAVIEATAEEAKTESQQENAEEAPAGAPEPRAQPPRNAPGTAPQRLLLWFALGFAGLALLVGLGVGSHLFVTTDGAIVDLRRSNAALQSHMAELDQKLAAAPNSAAALGSLERRVAALEAATQNAASAQNQAAPQPAAPPVDLTPLEQRVAAIEARLQPLAAVVAAAQSDVSADRDAVSKAVSASNGAALVVVAQSLLDSLDRGAPFASQVSAAQTLGADPGQIAALQAVADKGAPTAAALAESFAPLAAPILTGSKSKEPQGLLDRLERGASSLVRVRPVGAASGDDPAALVARIEDALSHGDVAAALSSWDRLPGPAKSVTDAWANTARARVGADSAAHALLADAIARLGRPKS